MKPNRWSTKRIKRFSILLPTKRRKNLLFKKRKLIKRIV